MADLTWDPFFWLKRCSVVLGASSPPQSGPAAPDPTEPLAVSSGSSSALAGHPQHLTQPRQTRGNAPWLQLAIHTVDEVRRAQKRWPQVLLSLSGLVCHVSQLYLQICRHWVSTLPSSFSRSPERTKPGIHVWSQHSLSPLLSFPVFLLFSGTRWVGFSISFMSYHFSFWLQIGPKDGLGLEMLKWGMWEFGNILRKITWLEGHCLVAPSDF